jgi:predicted oxidoreductase
MGEFDTGVWEIWIDDVDGELAMKKTELARREISVVELTAFNALEAENAKLREWKALGGNHTFADANYFKELRAELHRLKEENERLEVCADLLRKGNEVNARGFQIEISRLKSQLSQAVAALENQRGLLAWLARMAHADVMKDKISTAFDDVQDALAALKG